MRARSNTLCCDSLEDYIEAAKRTTSYLPGRPAHLRSNRPFSPTGDKIFTLDDEYTPNKVEKISQSQISSDDWLDFDYDSQKIANDNQASSLNSIHNMVDTDCSDDAETKSSRSTRQSILRKVMIIGLNGVDKHSLINTAFECKMQNLESKNQIMDLLTKTEQDEDDEREIRYQLWIQNLNSDNTNVKGFIQNLVKLYYKNVSMFVFMYSATDRKSFFRLEDAIKSVLQEVPSEKFVGMLVGIKSDVKSQSQVTLSEAASFQEKYGLNSCIETDHTDKSFKDTLVDLLVRNEEELSDDSRERRISILSID